eukprot:COSAG01_NODE_4048_length_5397_cov_110.731988_2_plen_85_part_00
MCTGIWLIHAPSRACAHARTHARSPDTAAGAEERRLHPKFGSARLHRVTLRPGERGCFHRVRVPFWLRFTYVKSVLVQKLKVAT